MSSTKLNICVKDQPMPRSAKSIEPKKYMIWLDHPMVSGIGTLGLLHLMVTYDDYKDKSSHHYDLTIK